MTWVPDKLIRDLVPDLIAEEGGVAITRPLAEREYGRALRTALQDSFRAYMARPGLGSMAELCEVLAAVRELNGFSDEELEQARAQLRAREGGFERRLVLLEITRAQPAAAPAPPEPAVPAPAVEDATVVSTQPLDPPPATASS